jgi:hypothetical protein
LLGEVLVVLIVLVLLFHCFNKLCHVLILSEKVGDLTVVKHIVDVFQEGLHDDLCITQQEDVRILVYCTVREELLSHVIVPISLFVTTCDFDLVEFIRPCNGDSEFGKTLSA